MQSLRAALSGLIGWLDVFLRLQRRDDNVHEPRPGEESTMDVRGSRRASQFAVVLEASEDKQNNADHGEGEED
jgi:hypothetical protein